MYDQPFYQRSPTFETPFLKHGKSFTTVWTFSDVWWYLDASLITFCMKYWFDSPWWNPLGFKVDIRHYHMYALSFFGLIGFILFQSPSGKIICSFDVNKKHNRVSNNCWRDFAVGNQGESNLSLMAKQRRPWVSSRKNRLLILVSIHDEQKIRTHFKLSSVQLF